MTASGKPIYAEDFGSYGDTAAIQAAIDASATGTASIVAGVPVVVGPGVWTGAPIVTRGKPLKFITAGREQTNIKVSNASIFDMITVDAPFVCEGLTISSSVAGSSRLGAGIRVLPSAGVGVRLTDILSIGHQMGLNSSAPAIWLDEFEASSNYLHGASIGDGVTPQTQLRFRELQLNNNGHIEGGVGVGDGLLVIGPAIGIYQFHTVTVGNKGNGARYVNPGNAPVADVFTYGIEVSGMNTSGGYGVNTTQNANGSNFNFYGGMIEGCTIAAFLAGIDGVNFDGVSITGNSNAGVINDSRGGSIDGGTFYSNGVDIVLGANCRDSTLEGMSSVPSKGASALGIRIDAGCGPVMASSTNLRATSPWNSSTAPSGSKIRGCYGIADQG
jgi:hypothetical protein